MNLKSILFLTSILFLVFKFNNIDASQNEKIDWDYIKKIKEGDREQQRLYPATIRYALNAYAETYGIIIEGEIKKGDADKFLRLIKDGNGLVNTVFLRSAGGDAIEAIKIGEIIRKLRLRTSAPTGTPERPGCYIHEPNKKEDCTCTSACFLIYIAGIYKEGDVLGIHRVYQNHDSLKNISFSEASKNAEIINKEVKKYLLAMGSPLEIIEKQSSISSKKIYFLNNREINTYFSGYLPEVDEWFIAKCGDSKSIDEERSREFNKNSHSKKGKELSDKLDKIIKCKLDNQYEITAEAYKEYFKK